MEVVLLGILVISLGIGFILTLLGLFGNTVIFGTVCAYTVITRFDPIGMKHLIVLGILFGVGEFIEYIFTILGVRLGGGSKLTGWMAILGTILGSLIGGMFGFAIGALVGGIIGAIVFVIGTELVKKKNFLSSVKAGIGVFLGKIGSIIVKVVIAIVMIVYTLFSIFYKG